MKQNVDMWREAVPIADAGEDDPVALYLASRGLRREEYTDADLRSHPSLAYYDADGKRGENRPAMLARVSTRDGKLALIHRTYLIPKDGGFAHEIKKMTSPAREWKGGCVRLIGTKDQSRLIIAEGIETALSVRAYLYRKHGAKFPVWAACNANALESIAVPEHIKHVIIAADNDESYTGQKVAYTLANRLVIHDRRAVQVQVAPQRGEDWNDELMRMK